MDNNLKYVPLYTETCEDLLDLPAEEAGTLIQAIVRYSTRGEEPVLGYPLNLVWRHIRHSLDNAAAKRVQNAQNGKNGGRPSKSSQPETQQKPTENRPETEQKPTENPTESETEPTEKPVSYRNLSYPIVSDRIVSDDVVVVGDARASEEAEHEDEMPVYPDFNPDKGWDRFMREYEQNLGVFPMAQRAIDEVQADYDDLGVDVMCEAVRQTALANPANPFQYFRGVLAKWRQKGYTTLQQVQADAIDHQRQKAQVARSGTSAAKPNPALQYEQRTYTDDDFSDMFVDLSNPESVTKAMGGR